MLQGSDDQILRRVIDSRYPELYYDKDDEGNSRCNCAACGAFASDGPSILHEDDCSDVADRSMAHKALAGLQEGYRHRRRNDR